MKKADIGLVGLAVMGENLVMNMESKGFTVAVFNRTVEKVTKFVEGRAKGKNIIGTYSLQELADSLEKPRKIMMMVKAGQAVDSLIDQLLPILDPGDILIDGGNSHFPDTIRRTEYVESKGLLYVGCGVSGGEEGALNGPSMMPGGSPAAWGSVKPIFQAICAKVSPRYSVWSRPMLVMTAHSSASMRFVASSRPPRPVSSTTMSHPSRANHTNAAAVMSSNSVGLSSMASATGRTCSTAAAKASSETGTPFTCIRSLNRVI